MEVTLRAAYIALQTGPFAALVFALPYTLYSYLRTKSVDVWKCTYFYIFCLYFLCAYFVTWLPLPTAETFARLRPMSEFIQLVPFQSFLDIEGKTLFRDLAIILFNVALTMPLGYFLRTLFRCSLKKTVLLGFCVSMLYELTQLTGLFFIYPRAYRIFDVDDLIINTLGAFLGYLVTPLIQRLLPAMSDSAGIRLVQGSEVSFSQRTIACAVDFLIILCCSIAVIFALPGIRGPVTDHSSLLRFPLFFLLFMGVASLYTLIFGSRSPGYRITGLNLMTAYGKKAGRGQCLARCLLLYGGVFSIPFWVTFFMGICTEYSGAKSILWVLISALLMMGASRNVLEMMFNAVTNGSSMFYDRLVKTHVAYGSSRKTSLFGIRVMDIRPLVRESVDSLSEEICAELYSAGVRRESVTKVRLMAEGVMLDWIQQDLEGTLCELRMDNRFRRKALMLSVPGENKTTHPISDSYVDMFSGMNLTLETYYAAEKNICIIHIP